MARDARRKPGSPLRCPSRSEPGSAGGPAGPSPSSGSVPRLGHLPMVLLPSRSPAAGWLSGVPQLNADDVACWLLKTAVSPEELAPGWAAGSSRSLTRCLRTSYRLELMTPGAPCLLWRSGRDRPGVHALGVLAAAPSLGAGGPEIAVRLTLLDRPLARADLLADPAFASAEVVRTPAGSNPSWLSADQYAAVLAALPDGAPPDPHPSAGTMEG